MKKTHTLVMIPGPTPVVEPIREEMAREIQAFGDPRFVADYKWLISIRYGCTIVRHHSRG